jgi:CheY-like chemotaxis protein
MDVNLILMDVNMPEMNGLEATTKIREMEKSGRLTRRMIALLTANGEEYQESNFLQDFTLSKPF